MVIRSISRRLSRALTRSFAGALAGLAVLALCATTASAQQFVTLDPGWSVNDISSDGEWVVGDGHGGPFVWRWKVDPQPTLIGGVTAVAISNDGTYVAGSFEDLQLGTVPGRWSQATGWVSLGLTPQACGIGSASDISADGKSIVGLVWVNGCDARAFLWREGIGAVPMDSLANGTNRATCINGTGDRIGGFAQGSFSRTPAFWSVDGTGSTYDINVIGETFGFNEDGSLALLSADQDALIQDSVGNVNNIGRLNAGNLNWSGRPADVTQDGFVVVGHDVSGLAREGWIWTPNDGIRSANDRLADVGLVGTPFIQDVTGVSEDGSVFVGNADDPSPVIFSTGFIASDITYPFDGTWQNLGGATPGAAGFPALEGSGPLTGGSLATLSLTNTPPNAIMLAWLSFAPGPPQNFFGGTIHALPFNNQFFFFSDALGEWSATVPWPAGVPSGTEVWFQFLVEDVSVVYTLTLSNGVKATTP